MATTAIAAVRTQRSSLQDPLALWHLLSLDAPTVAAVWTVFFSYYFDVALPWCAPAALALAVWLVYVADRLYDARDGTEPLEERHLFHARHARAFHVAMCVVGAGLAVLVVMLPHGLRTAWMLLGVPMMGYVAAVHGLRRRVPKEAMVGVFFAAAAAMPALLAVPSPSVVVAAVLFGVLCWLNCVFIARSEGAEIAGTLTGLAARHFMPATLSLLVTALVVFALFGDCGLAVGLGAALLLLLDMVRESTVQHNSAKAAVCSPPRVRVRALADAALMTPLLVMPLLRLLR